MSIQMNQSLSVDCAVFGFNGKSLKVLLIERRYYAPDTRLDKLKLPGAMILDNETLPQAAYRVLEEATGLRDVYLKQMDIFSDPNRVSGEELEWINRYHGIRTERVVTVGYYALVKLGSLPRDAAIARGFRTAATQIHHPRAPEPLQRSAGHRNRQPQLPQEDTRVGVSDPDRRTGTGRSPQAGAILYL